MVGSEINGRGGRGAWRRAFSCVAMVLGVCAARAVAVEMTVVPTRATGVEGIDWYLGPGERQITLFGTGQTVELEVFLSGFAPEEVESYDCTIDCALFSSGTAGSTFAVDTECPFEGTFGVDFCLGVDQSRPDFVFSEAQVAYVLCQHVIACPNGDPGQYRCGAGVTIGPFATETGTASYLATFAMTLSADARGDFQVSLDPEPSLTHVGYLSSEEPIEVDILGATLTVAEGRCCGLDGPPLACADGFVRSDCEAAGGIWSAEQTCANGDVDPIDGIDDACDVCGAASDCDDGNACTDDLCDDGFCRGVPGVPVGQCCNPDTGELIEAGDGDACTADICQADGSVQHILDVPVGQCCDSISGNLEVIDDGDPCTVDTCLPDGSVTHEESGACDEPTQMVIRPVSASGVEGVDWEHGPSADEITLYHGNQDVALEVFLSGFGPDGLAVYQVGFDCGSLQSPTSVPLVLNAEACTDFNGSGCTGVDIGRPDFVFAEVIGSLLILDTPNGCEPGSFIIGVLQSGGDIQDGGEVYYLVTLSLHVPVEARGTFTPRLSEAPNETLLANELLFGLPIDEHLHGAVTIPTGACCRSVGDCQEGMIRPDCEAIDGAVWLPGETCEVGCAAVPATGQWGLVILALGLLALHKAVAIGARDVTAR